MDLSALPTLRATIDRHGLMAKKSLGQHFLLDERITNQIAAFAGDVKGCSVIEIGPGPGGLTRSLLKAGATVYALEKDERCVAALSELQQLARDRLHIISGDAMKIKLSDIASSPRKIVANLPYNVGTPLLINWLEEIYQNPKTVASMTLMFQKEVAERILAAHGNKDFGRLSVLAQWLCEVRGDMELPPGAFLPPPKVTSSVITLTPRNKPLVNVSRHAMEKTMAAAFGQRRKMLRGALKGLPVPAEALLKEANIDGSLRAEQLDVMTLCNLAAAYQRLSTKSERPS